MIPGVTYHPREAWQDPRQPVEGPPIELAEIDTFALHYTALAVIPQDVAAFLRAIQRDYTTNRGYSNGYNFAVDQRGEVWEIRGFDYRSAANRGWNYRTIAVLCLVDGSDALTMMGVRAVNQVLAEADRRTGKQLNVVPHSEIGATLCPGDGVRGQIAAGLFTLKEAPMGLQVIDAVQLFDSRHPSNSVVRDFQAVPVVIPGEKPSGVLIAITNVSRRSEAVTGHIRVAGSNEALEASSGWAHTESDGVGQSTLTVPTPDGVIWVQPRHCENADGTPVGTDVEVVLLGIET